MKKKPLHVSLRVHQPSMVELTVGDKVQLDRVVDAPDGYLAERHGGLLEPGSNTLALAQGIYFFKTLSPAHLKVISGGVDATPAPNNKDGGFPDQTITGAPPAPSAKGDEPAGEAPAFTIE